MVRSVAKQRLSNHRAAPSLETRLAGAPQDEAGKFRRRPAKWQ
jgi:hypothetical protein